MSRLSTILPAWLPIVEFAGGIGRAAESIGVSTRTLQRWGTGERIPRAIERGAIIEWCRHRGVVPPFQH